MSNIVIYHNNLCPDIWDENYNLNSGIRLNLLKIAKDFYEKIKFEAPILDIYFMGSMASFNWNIESDIDVHVVIDLKSLKMPEETSEKMAKLVGSQWNSEHDILIKGHKVEMNIQSLTAEKPYVNGIYSLVKNLWIKRPSKQNPNAIDTPSIQLKYGGMKKYILDTIATRDREKLKAAKDYIDAFRQYGLDNDGELSIENITYKLLRTKGIIQQLKDAISNIYDKQLSINEVNQSDLKQRHPVWAGNDLSQLTLDNLNALKNKSVRFYNAAKKSENREMFNQAVKDYIVYRNEIKRRLEIINRPINESNDSNYDCHADFLERKNAQLYELANFLKSNKTGNIPWKTISATLLKKTWLLFGKYNKVNDNAIDKIADQLLTNIVRLTLANEFTGHSENYHLREEIDEMCDIQFTDEEWEAVCWRFEDKNGRDYISDYGIKPLQNIYSVIFNAKTPEEKLYACDKALNVVHQRSDLAAMFVEGGQTTLTQIATQGGYNAGYEYGQMNREFRESLINEAISHPQSNEFKSWFGNSKVVDSSGNPLVVYHGTNQPISAFSKKRLGMNTQASSAKRAFFFTDSQAVAGEYASKAGRTVRSNISKYEKKIKEYQKKVERLEKYAQLSGNWKPYEKAIEEYENYDIGTSREDDITGQNILPVFLKIENPLVYDFKGLSAFNNETSNLIDMAIKSGNDGLILKNVNDPEPVSTHYIVFKSNQIKSAIGNVGTFSSKHSSIVKEAIGWHGAYQAILLSNPPKLVFTNNDEDTHVAIFRRVFNDEMETLMSQLENAGYGDSDDPDCQYPAANQLADKYNVARCIIERDGICYVNTPKNRELTNSQLRILRDYCIEHKLRLKQGNREIELEEGVGGNPETDKAYVKGDRWRVKWDNAKKTPLMKESISQGLFKWFKQQLPTWPDYVINDMFVVKLKSRKEVEEKREHMNFIKKKYPNMKWELKVLEVTFDIFDRDTQDALKKRDGGKCNPNQVPNDVARHAVQSNLLKSRGVSKEPLIMIKNGNSYSLWEGWHRTIQNLNQFPNGYKCNAWIGIP
jgi:predicted nucleotidyltransferase